MKLRPRILLAIGATTVALIGGIYVLCNSLLLTSYLELEKREAGHNVDRVRDMMEGQAYDLYEHSLDWANWDESYQFIQDRNPAYIRNNLSVMTLKLDMMLFLDEHGKTIYSRPVQRTAGVKPPNPEEVRQILGFDKPEGVVNRSRQFGGLANIGGHLSLVSVRPISPVARPHDPRGWLVWVRYFDKAEIRNLSRRLHLTYNLYLLDAPHLPMEVTSALTSLNNQPQDSSTKSLSETEIGGYGLLEDFKGAPVALVRTVQNRSIYRQGLDSGQQLMALIIVASLVFILVFIAVVDSFALNRISRLNTQVNRISDGNSDSVITLAGNDELSWLAKSIQGMVSKLRDKREELRLNHDRLQETVSKLAAANSVLEHAVEGIARIDYKGHIAATNVSFAKNLGYRRGELCERSWEAIVHPNDHARFQAAIEEAKNTGKTSIEIQACRFDKSTYYAEVVIVRSERVGTTSESFHLFMKDISERKWLETRIEHQAFHDSLTGLPNRAKFMDRLSHAIARSKRRMSGVAVLFMDLDNFKIINDSLGHEAGDLLLVGISQRLQECLREEDTIARLGGDEFTVLIQDLDSIDKAIEVANRIVESLAQPIHLGSNETVAMASIGIAFSMCGEELPEELLRDADTAMYAAKSRGKSGYVIFDPSMNEQVVERMELEVGMRRALEAKEFDLEYQPIVDLTSGDIIGFEALLRWEHPEKGRIPPDKFIAVAEDSGLIAPIGAWVLREACQRYVEVQKQFQFEKPLSLSVNFSGRQLQRPEAVGQIKEILEETGMEPSLLKIEVTETVLIRDEVESVEKLHQIKALGVKIAIDDFGTGYSSLSSLNSSPVDVVKIDRAFISRMGKEEEVDAIVGAIILLSRVMNLEVTAEGIETREQVQYLQAFGCDQAQGFYFSRPLTFEGLCELLGTGLNLSIALEGNITGIKNPILAA